MEKKKINKPLMFSILLILAAITIGVGYWFISGKLNEPMAENTDNGGHPIKVDNMVDKQSWDTITGKTDVLDKLNENDNTKKQNEALFKDNMDEQKRLAKDYPVPDNKPETKPTGSSGSSGSHQKTLQERLKSEVAKDNLPSNSTHSNPISSAVQNTKKTEEPKPEVRNEEPAGDFQFGGFVVDRPKKKSQSPVTKSPAADEPTTSNYKIPEAAQATGTVASKTKIYYNSSLAIKLKEDLIIATANVTIPKGTVITALSHLSGQRVMGRVEGINLNGKIIKAGLTIYDMDGNEGLLVGALKKDVNGNVTNGIDNAIGTASSSMGLGAQMIGGILSSVNKSTNKAEAIIPEGYKVIVRE